jgi:hypothetical protein
VELIQQAGPFSNPQRPIGADIVGMGIGLSLATTSLEL